MDEQQKNEKSPEESLASVPPNPVEPTQTPRPRNVALNAALLAGAGAGAFFLLASTMTPCVGATRSAKLKWEERQLEIEQAEQDAESSDADKQD